MSAELEVRPKFWSSGGFRAALATEAAMSLAISAPLWMAHARSSGN